MLNAGRGFNDAFEEQIGLQAESKSDWKIKHNLNFAVKYRVMPGEQKPSPTRGRVVRSRVGANLFSRVSLLCLHCHRQWRQRRETLGTRLSGFDTTPEFSNIIATSLNSDLTHGRFALFLPRIKWCRSSLFYCMSYSPDVYWSG